MVSVCNSHAYMCFEYMQIVNTSCVVINALSDIHAWFLRKLYLCYCAQESEFGKKKLEKKKKRGNFDAYKIGIEKNIIHSTLMNCKNLNFNTRHRTKNWSSQMVRTGINLHKQQNAPSKLFHRNISNTYTTLILSIFSICCTYHIQKTMMRVLQALITHHVHHYYRMAQIPHAIARLH